MRWLQTHSQFGLRKSTVFQVGRYHQKRQLGSAAPGLSAEHGRWWLNRRHRRNHSAYQWPDMVLFYTGKSA